MRRVECHRLNNKADKSPDLSALFSSCSFVGAQTQSCRFTCSGCFDMFHRCAESEQRHVAIDAFELIRVDDVCLMPDTDDAIRTDCLVEFLPRPEMRLGWLPRKPFQVFEGT